MPYPFPFIMIHNEEQNLGKMFAQEIDLVAKLRLKGITPLLLQDQGDLQNATELSNLIGQLDINNLMPLVDQRVNALRQQEEHPVKQKPGPSVTPSQPSRQDNFFSLVDSVKTPQSTTETPNDWQDPERHLARLYRAFQQKNGFEKNRLLAPDASREAREFYKEIGVPTWPEKRKILTERYKVYVTFLQDIGLWDTVSKYGVTDEIKDQLREIYSHLKSYMFDYDPVQQKTVARFLRVVLQENPKDK